MATTKVKLSGIIVGYDPGGDRKHGLALLTVNGGKVVEIQTKTHATVQCVLNELSKIDPLAIGLDTLTCWSSGRAGWRPADRALQMRYPEVSDSVMAPNALRGAMCINGMIVMHQLHQLRKGLPDLLVTETHPKVLYHALRPPCLHEYGTPNGDMDAWLSKKLTVALKTKNDHEWDAAISAYAAFMAYYEHWKTDLHQLEDRKGLIEPVKDTLFAWPEAIDPVPSNDKCTIMIA